jgi:hypothetical protein
MDDPLCELEQQIRKERMIASRPLMLTLDAITRNPQPQQRGSDPHLNHNPQAAPSHRSWINSISGRPILE